MWSYCSVIEKVHDIYIIIIAALKVHISEYTCNLLGPEFTIDRRGQISVKVMSLELLTLSYVV